MKIPSLAKHLAVGLALTIAGFIGAIGILTLVFAPPTGTFAPTDSSAVAAWAAGAATVFTGLAALYIAGAQGRRTAEEQKEKAALYAASLAPMLGIYASNLKVAAVGAFFVHDNPEPALPGMQEQLANAAIDVSMEQLMQLVPLERRAAHRIARGLRLAEIAIRQIRSYANPETIENSVALRLAGDLLQAAEMLQVANETCTRAAEAYAKFPTAEEIHGPYEDERHVVRSATGEH